MDSDINYMKEQPNFIGFSLKFLPLGLKLTHCFRVSWHKYNIFMSESSTELQSGPWSRGCMSELSPSHSPSELHHLTKICDLFPFIKTKMSSFSIETELSQSRGLCRGDGSSTMYSCKSGESFRGHVMFFCVPEITWWFSLNAGLCGQIIFMEE